MLALAAGSWSMLVMLDLFIGFCMVFYFLSGVLHLGLFGINCFMP